MVFLIEHPSKEEVSMQKPRFTPGKNIAMKIPSHQYEETVTFYRDILGMSQVRKEPSSTAFEFGGKTLWLDRVEHLSQAEIWLEVLTDDLGLAANRFKDKNVIRRDEIEKLPEDFEGFWISNTAGVIHLVTRQ